MSLDLHSLHKHFLPVYFFWDSAEASTSAESVDLFVSFIYTVNYCQQLQTEILVYIINTVVTVVWCSTYSTYLTSLSSSILLLNVNVKYHLCDSGRLLTGQSGCFDKSIKGVVFSLNTIIFIFSLHPNLVQISRRELKMCNKTLQYVMTTSWQLKTVNFHMQNCNSNVTVQMNHCSERKRITWICK